jgi:hypothetical protein
MAVSIGTSPTGRFDDIDYSGGIYFKSDGSYWFLYPWWERIGEQTGQMIDLYGDAVFGFAAQPILLASLQDAFAKVQQRPSEWDMCIGWGVQPVYARVSRMELQQLLTEFIRLVTSATERQRYVVCFGD